VSSVTRAGFRLGLGGIVILLAAACSGDGSGGGDRSEGALRRTAEQFVADLFDQDVPPSEVTRFFAGECREDAAEAVLLARVVIGDADVDVDITNVEFKSTDQALVTSVLLFEGDALEEDGLWVFEDGHWRNADDCAAFGT